MDAERRRFGHLHFGDQIARTCIPTRKINARCIANETAASITANEVRRTQQMPVRQCDTDTPFVLREVRHVACAIPRHRQRFHPTGQYARYVVLPERQTVVVPRGEVTQIQTSDGKSCDLRLLSFGEKAINNAALIKHFKCARGEAARA